MSDQCIDSHLVTMHDVENTFWQTRLVQQLGQTYRDRRIALRGFQQEGVAAGQCHREHPTRHHGGKIERGDSRYDTQGLAQRPVVDSVADLVRVLPLEQMRNATRKLDDFHTPRDFAACVALDLAMLAGYERREFIDMCIEQLFEAEQNARALDRRSLSPGRPGGSSRGH